jgi:hypothetical protein
MKKLLTIVALACMTSVAVAQTSASVDLQTQSFANGSPDQQQITLNIKRKVTDLLSVDGGVQVSQNENSTTASKAYKVGGRYEAGLTAQKAIFASPCKSSGTAWLTGTRKRFTAKRSRNYRTC